MQEIVKPSIGDALKMSERIKTGEIMLRPLTTADFLRTRPPQDQALALWMQVV